MRMVIVLLAAVAVGVGAFLLTQDDERASTPDLDAESGGPGGVEEGARLEGREGDPTPSTPEPSETRPARPAHVKAWMQGRVTDAETGAPLPGAALRMQLSSPACPGVPDHGAPGLRPGDPQSGASDPREIVHAVTDAEGRYRILRGPTDPRQARDVYVFAKGYIPGASCAVRGGTVDMALTPGKRLEGQVQDRLGRPVVGAHVRAIAPEAVQQTLAMFSEALTDELGRFVLQGLGTDPLRVRVDHQGFMTHVSAPVVAGRDGPLTLILLPAWQVTLRITTDDGQRAVHPNYRWITDGTPPQTDLGMLPLQEPEQEGDPLVVAHLRIPCLHERVTVEVKADGYSPWRVDGEPLPPEGGEHTFEVYLERDRSQGTLIVEAATAEGDEVLDWRASGVRMPPLVWLGERGQAPRTYVQQPSSVMTLSSLKAGPYRITVYHPNHAPTSQDVTVVGGETTKTRVRLQPPAKLRIAFRAPREGRVRFRIEKDGQPVHAFPIEDPGAEGEADAAGMRPLHAAPGNAILLSGLGAGTHHIVVVDEVFQAAPVALTLTPGETTEAEVDLQEK